MDRELRHIVDEKRFESDVQALKKVDSDPLAGHCVVLSAIGSGLLRFTNAVFPGAQTEEICAKHYIREPEGQGVHFDVYSDQLKKDYPWLAVYNLAGKVSLGASKLPDDLAESYFKRFPNPNKEAFQACRDYSSLALNFTETRYTAELDDDNGFVILQRPEGPHIIHDVVPENPENPGEFVKFVVPKDDKESQKLLREDGMVPLDELVSSALVKGVGRTS